MHSFDESKKLKTPYSKKCGAFALQILLKAKKIISYRKTLLVKAV